MGLPGDGGKGRGDRQDLHAAVEHATKHLRKTQVVADRDTHAAERRVQDESLAPRLDRCRLLVTLSALGQTDVEQMDLVVTAHPLAAIVEHQTGGAHLACIVGGQRDGAADEPDALLLGHPRQKRLQGAVAVLFAQRQLILIAFTHEGEVLGKHDETRTLVLRSLDQAFRLEEVGVYVWTGRHLDRSDLRFCLHGLYRNHCCPGRRRGGPIRFGLRRDPIGDSGERVMDAISARACPSDPKRRAVTLSIRNDTTPAGRPKQSRSIGLKPRPVRYAMFLDGIGPGSFYGCWSRRGLRD